ncbi:Putative rmlC-like cupin domain superfamily, rmlC-like jelly roll protein [Colletotrichum destructivum]|uniref:RmlC-like cupin domain superfamily, rmlC-like jelly roll protein n=1 Tax=Colletotrichum destructivum TaxID=34406 RepID=A0AAX4IL23_9PEZI|nr:Putative rmlC-like cupin domain superfamily, rmlC-like jelly roll protein [Colletotrichum destructivum]
MPLRGPVPVKLCKKEDSEVVRVGPMTVYIFEDGSNTDNRIGCMTLELPPAASGPPMHWHRFHDECFLVTKGTVRFTTPDGDVDAEEGQLMVVPPRAIHTFSNPSETEPAEFFMTSTPGYYMDYFRTMSKTVAEGKKLSREETQHLMALFGTFPPDVESEP